MMLMSWGDILPYWGGDAPVLNFNPRQLQVLNTVGFLGIAHEADSLAFLDILGEIPKNPWQSKGAQPPPNCHRKTPRNSRPYLRDYFAPPLSLK